MTFTEIRTEIMDRLGYTSTTAQTRIGRLINKIYREVGTSIGMSFARQTNTSVVVTIGNANVTFTGTEKIIQVWRLDSSTPIILDEVLLPELRESITPSSDKPTAWALVSTASNTVTVRLNASPATAYTLYADIIAEVSDLSGSNEPAFSESFHDILIDGVLKEEYKKQEKIALARESSAEFQRRMSDLRMFAAKSAYMDIQQGKRPDSGSVSGAGSGTATQSVTGPASSTDNAIVRFNGTGGTIIQDSGITIADGATGTLSGTNSGDVTLAGTPDYITISSQVITRGEIQNDDLRDSGALSVVGRSANSTGDVADISASAASGAVLRESGSALGFGTVATAGLTNDAVTDPKLRDSGALSVIGRSANTTGDPADISASAASGAVLRESGSTLGFGTVATAGIADAAITYPKIQDVSATQRVLGRNTTGAGDVEEVTWAQFMNWLASSAQGDILYRGASDWTRLAAGTSGQYLQTLGAGANPQWTAAPTSAMTLLIAESGNTTSAVASNVSTVAISGLTVKDQLLFHISLESVTQATAESFIYDVTDSGNFLSLGGAGVSAGNRYIGQASVFLAANSSTVGTRGLGNFGLDGTPGTNINTFNMTTNWTGSWTLGLRIGAVTVGGTLHWRWAAYKILGQ